MQASRTNLRIEHAVIPALAPRPFFMLPGLGADHRVFEEQIRDFPHLRTPSWIRPRDRETLTEYAERFARWLNLQPGSVIGGSSFGGMVALEMARRPWVRENLAGIVLISACRSRHAISTSFRYQAWLANHSSDKALRKRLLKQADRAGIVEGLGRRYRNRLIEMARRADLDFHRWAMRESCRWHFNGPEVEYSDVPILHVHGRHDRTIPMISGEPTVLLDGGHHIPFTHSTIVNDTIRRWMSEL